MPEKTLIINLESIDTIEPIPDAFFNPLYEKLKDDVLNIPLFMADQTDRLIGLALEQRQCLF